MGVCSRHQRDVVLLGKPRQPFVELNLLRVVVRLDFQIVVML